MLHGVGRRQVKGKASLSFRAAAGDRPLILRLGAFGRIAGGKAQLHILGDVHRVRRVVGHQAVEIRDNRFGILLGVVIGILRRELRPIGCALCGEVNGRAGGIFRCPNCVIVGRFRDLPVGLRQRYGREADAAARAARVGRDKDLADEELVARVHQLIIKADLAHIPTVASTIGGRVHHAAVHQDFHARGGVPGGNIQVRVLHLIAVREVKLKARFALFTAGGDAGLAGRLRILCVGSRVVQRHIDGVVNPAFHQTAQAGDGVFGILSCVDIHIVCVELRPVLGALCGKVDGGAHRGGHHAGYIRLFVVCQGQDGHILNDLYSLALIRGQNRQLAALIRLRLGGAHHRTVVHQAGVLAVHGAGKGKCGAVDGAGDVEVQGSVQSVKSGVAIQNGVTGGLVVGISALTCGARRLFGDFADDVAQGAFHAVLHAGNRHIVALIVVQSLDHIGEGIGRTHVGQVCTVFADIDLVAVERIRVIRRNGDGLVASREGNILHICRQRLAAVFEDDSLDGDGTRSLGGALRLILHQQMAVFVAARAVRDLHHIGALFFTAIQRAAYTRGAGVGQSGRQGGGRILHAYDQLHGLALIGRRDRKHKAFLAERIGALGQALRAGEAEGFHLCAGGEFHRALAAVRTEANRVDICNQPSLLAGLILEAVIDGFVGLGAENDIIRCVGVERFFRQGSVVRLERMRGRAQIRLCLILHAVDVVVGGARRDIQRDLYVAVEHVQGDRFSRCNGDIRRGFRPGALLHGEGNADGLPVVAHIQIADTIFLGQTEIPIHRVFRGVQIDAQDVLDDDADGQRARPTDKVAAGGVALAGIFAGIVLPERSAADHGIGLARLVDVREGLQMAERLPKGQLTVAVILQALDVLERRRRPNRTVPILAGGIEGRPVIGNCGQALRTEHLFGVQRIVPDHRVGAFRRRHVCGQRPQAGRGGNVRELLVFIQVEIELPFFGPELFVDQGREVLILLLEALLRLCIADLMGDLGDVVGGLRLLDAQVVVRLFL